MIFLNYYITLTTLRYSNLHFTVEVSDKGKPGTMKWLTINFFVQQTGKFFLQFLTKPQNYKSRMNNINEYLNIFPPS